MWRIAPLLLLLSLLAGCEEPCDEKRERWRAVVGALPNDCVADFDCALVGAIAPDSCSWCRISVSEGGVAVNYSRYLASRGPALASAFARSCGGGMESCHAVRWEVGCRGGRCVITGGESCFSGDAAVPDARVRDAAPADGGAADAAGAD